MSQHSLPFKVQGRCPGALVPMASGDGLIVRVRPRLAALSIKQAAALAGLARRHGNGIIELTRRANVQLRGVREECLAPLHDGLRQQGLIDAHPQAEAVRNVLLSPLAGLDAAAPADGRPLAAALARHLAEDVALWELPAKFGFLVDDGSEPDLHEEAADIRIEAREDAGGGALWSVRAGGDGTLPGDAGAAVAAAVDLARSFLELRAQTGCKRMRDVPAGLRARLWRPVPGARPMPAGRAMHPPRAGVRRALIRSPASGAALARWLAMPFGQIMADDLAVLCERLADIGVTQLRLSPWRAIYVPLDGHEGRAAVVAEAGRAAGLLTDPDDPLLGVVACPGAPLCPQAHIETRGLARALAGLVRERGGTVHVSGCAKSCASSRRAELTVVGRPDGYGIARGGRAAEPPDVVLAAGVPPLAALRALVAARRVPEEA